MSCRYLKRVAGLVTIFDGRVLDRARFFKIVKSGFSEKNSWKHRSCNWSANELGYELCSAVSILMLLA